MSVALTPLQPWIHGLLAAQGHDRQDLAGYQLRRLNQVLAYVRQKSPFYRDRLAGLSQEPLGDLAALADLPFTTADDLRGHHLAMLCISHGEVARVVTLRSSGTTAEPKRLYFSPEDLELTRDFFHHGMTTFVNPGGKVLIMLPGPTQYSVGDLLSDGLARVPAQSKVHWPVRDLARVAAEIAEQGFDALVGAPAQVFALARHPAGRDLGKGALKGVLLSTDYVPRAVVHEIKATWGCPVYEHYGMTETGYGGGVHCAALSGYHLREADLLCEVIDPHTGRPCPPEVAGEVVFTTLTRRAMPLIRYRTGDLAAFIGEPCPCGARLPRLGEVQGRLAGGVDLGGNIRLTMPRLDEVVMPVAGVVGYAARREATSQGNSLHLTLYCLPEKADAARKVVWDAVSGMPEIRSAGEALCLEVEAKPFSELTWEASGMIKREVGGA